ncbi:hypothetical protein OEB99_11685 [Actinotalea sp. M2MS4P-6]|uniref:hypothetical protein n=1 Tax=Actinotalea sp. M2MS4P-6 TaxID=2983762 RepID=UPI0021E3CE05|nr:hypothetical protein [Actinotalea sp. M2MS4P-6]MCV2394969.1 hypothetical protein [Actinotalea sp. M2MS4P-6]
MSVRLSGTVVVAMGVALLGGCTSAAEPAAEPSPSTTSTTPVSTPTPTPTLLTTVTVDPSFPEAEPLTAGLLATTDATWLVARVVASDAGSPEPRAVVHYLISPDGTRYELPDLGDVTVVQWLPGTPDALVLGSDGTAATMAVVDLETGRSIGDLDWSALLASEPEATGVSVTLLGGSEPDLIVTVDSPTGGRVLATTVDGSITASVDADWWGVAPAPDGHVLLAVDPTSGQVVEVDPATLQETAHPLDGSCWPTWLDDDRWLAGCQEGGRGTWYLVGPTGVTPLAVDDASVVALGTDDGSVVLALGDGTSGGEQRVVEVADGAVREVDTGLGYVTGATRSALLGSTTAPGWGAGLLSGQSAPLLAWLPSDGSVTSLVPAGPDGAATVFPVGGPGAPLGGWLDVTDDGVQFVVAD